MPEESSTRASIESGEQRQCGRRAATAPRRRPGTPAAAARPSNTRAPVQVTAKEVNRRALARSIEIASGTEPYMPNSMTEPARSRCAQPHQATA